MGLKSMLINMGIFGLLVFSIISFTIITQQDSSITNKITDNEIINETFEDLNTQLGSEEAETISDNFGENPPTETQYGDLSVTSIISPTTFIITTTVGFWNIFVKLPASILGMDQMIFSFLGSILLIFLIIGAWAIWKGVIEL